MRRRVLTALSRHGPTAAAVGILALSFTATLVVVPWSDESVGDLGVRSGFAALMLDGALPYRDFLFEYPPLAAPAIAVPGVVGTEAGPYRAGIAGLAFLLAVAVLLLAGSLARRTGGRPWVAMLAVAVTPLLLGAVVRLHFDLLPVALTLGALAAVLARRPALGLVLLGAGAMTKGFPLVVAPVALAWLWGREGPRAALRGLAVLSATLAVASAAWMSLSPEGALDSLAYQLDRPVQVESAQASALFVAGALGGEQPEVIQSHRAAALVHPLAGEVGAGFALVLLAAVGAMSAGAGLAARRGAGPPGDGGAAGPRLPTTAADRALVLASLGAVASFAAFGRVLSPQYLVWVAPLLALAASWRMWGLAAASATACVLTLVEFPFRYLDLLGGDPVAVAVVAARNAVLVAVVGMAGAGVWRAVAPSAGPSRAVIPAGGGSARSISPAPPAPPR